MKVKKTLKGNVKIVLSMTELEALKTILNYSHCIKDGNQEKVEGSEWVSRKLCHLIVDAVGVIGK